MPYTPPATQSPAASRPVSPSLSRTNSCSNDQYHDKGTPSSGTRPSLPRLSSSYLSKHRRSPSVTQTPSFTTEVATSAGSRPEKSLDANCNQGPSPTSEKNNRPAKLSSTATDSSPSVSPSSSGDDDTAERRGRERDATNLAELHAAIRIIEQHRAGSPDGQAHEGTKEARMALGLPAPRLENSNIDGASQSERSPRLPLSAGARKISHSRSTTDATAFFDFPRNKFDSPARSTSQSDDEDIEDDELRIKPALIRKKSGELVRPALRPSSAKRRPSSMPGTPTYSKAVRFQENSLEHVRHFLQVDRPIAVSAGSSPVEPCDDDTEFPFAGDGLSSPSSQNEWEIRLTNFPRDTVERQALPVRTEKVYLSADNKVLIGSVAVRNIAFRKLVVARFTLDYWKTTSEVVAEYNHEVRNKHTDDGCDRFTFSIKLEDQTNLESKTMFFCVRYRVNGQDYWDNNKSINYQVEFVKKPKPRQGAQAEKPPNARSKPLANRSPRPRSMPSFDDFANMTSPYEFTTFPQPSAIVGDSPIRFRNKPANEIVPDAPGKPKTSANQAFGNRYDFGASLSAAIQAAGSSTDSLREDTKSVPTNKVNHAFPAAKVQSTSDTAEPVKRAETGQVEVQETPKPTALTSEKPSLSSSSYHELLDKYCFFGSGKSISQPSKPSPLQLDGASDDSAGSENGSGKNSGSSSPSPRGSPPTIGERKAEEKTNPPRITSPPASRSVSPAAGAAMGSRTASPGFGYPYHHHMQSGLLETHAPTAIRG